MSANQSETPKDILRRYLDEARASLLGKLDGVSERDIRWPMVPTGTNLLGLVKHTASVELGYLGEVFGRPSEIKTPWIEDGAELNADLWATADETREEIIALHQAAAAHADATIAALELDAPGHVPWWRTGHQEVTLHRILVHLIAETARHAGQADILREQIDGRAGMMVGDSNVPDQSVEDWAAYRARLENAAETGRTN